jgi:hypothetical protein
MGDDIYLTEERGEVSLRDGDTLKTLLKEMSGKDFMP